MRRSTSLTLGLTLALVLFTASAYAAVTPDESALQKQQSQSQPTSETKNAACFAALDTCRMACVGDIFDVASRSLCQRGCTVAHTGCVRAISGELRNEKAHAAHALREEGGH